MSQISPTLPPPRFAFARRLAWGALWLLIILLLELALCRLFFYDRAEFLIWINVLTPYLYLPAYPILLLALCTRRRGLALAATVLAVLHLIWVLPPLLPAPTAAAAAGPTVRIFNANLFAGNREFAAMLAEIQAADPDVLVLQEYTPGWHRAFVDAGIAETYPYSLLDVHPSPFGAAIWSKLPLEAGEVWSAAGADMLRATLRVQGTPVRLYGVHPPPPLRDIPRWDQQMGALAATIAAESGPTIVAGDFNVTPQNRWYREMVNGRYRDAHQACGRGWATTWPNGTRLVPPVRLDHVLISSEISCLVITEGLGRGSDHRPIVVSVALKAES
ncbi:MAG: endonuclease/exonuclease/phosphatase family protein [Anaerolineales bacterium]|nr:endonuclease/exonuclease/phosphatase family protein [Anaerolineales bacterium]